MVHVKQQPTVTSGDSLMHPTITCKLKSSEKKDFSRQFYPQDYDFAIFVPKKLRMTGKPIQFAAKVVRMNRQKNLMIFSFTIFSSNLKKHK